MQRNTTNRIVNAAAAALVYFGLAAIAGVLFQPVGLKILGYFNDSTISAMGLVSGFFIFASLLMVQEEVLPADSIWFRAPYAIGCIGFAVISAPVFWVMVLQLAFVVLLGWKVYISSK